MLGMVIAFTVMSGLYLSALGLGPAANAIFLQNTAPVWVYLLRGARLGERGDRRGWQTVLLAAAGAVVIVAGDWPRNDSPDGQDGSADPVHGSGKRRRLRDRGAVPARVCGSMRSRGSSR